MILPFKIRLSIWLSVFLLIGPSVEIGAQSLPAEVKPADFAYGIQIDTVGLQPVQVIELPPAVYEHLTREDLGDLRVFNAGEAPVPHALDVPPRYLSSQNRRNDDSTAATIKRHWADLPLSLNEDGAFVGTIPGTIPADYVEIELPDAQSLVRIRVESADTPDGPWTHHYSGLAYNLQAGDENRASPPIATYRNTHRHWRLMVDDEAGTLVGNPSLRFGWIPARLLFVAQGDPPYTLAFGNAKAQPAGFKAHELFEPMRSDFAQIKDLPLATVGEVESLGGDKRLKKSADINWQQYILWASMIAGVLVLGGMAMRLMRAEPVKTEDKEDPSTSSGQA